jgi:hypothetical protein
MTFGSLDLAAFPNISQKAPAISCVSPQYPANNNAFTVNSMSVLSPG